MRGLFAVVLCLALPVQAMAGGIVLDDEFSAYCQTLVAPLRPKLPHTETVSFVLVADDSLNAFVTPENVVHVHAGLVAQAKGSNDIQGVLAHELGHVSSQHLFKVHDNLKTAMLTGIAGAVVGVGAAVAGAPQVAAAAITTGQAGAVAQMLRYSRTQEQEADQRAIAALHGAGLSAKGMVNTFEKLRVEGQLSYGSIPQYLLTHPLPQARLQSLQHAVEKETASSTDDRTFPRMQAKVYALTHSPNATLRKYTGNETPARYAQALARLAQGRFDEAAALTSSLLKETPNDPYYQEVAAQIALQRGDVAGAVQGFGKIVQAHPKLPLIRYQLGNALLALGKPAEALPHFRQITQDWRVWAEPWRGMGLAYGQTGKLALSHLSLAQAAIYSADLTEARQQLNFAKNFLNKTPDAAAQGWADDLTAFLDRTDTSQAN